jgi:hypothetical protein
MLRIANFCEVKGVSKILKPSKAFSLLLCKSHVGALMYGSL